MTMDFDTDIHESLRMTSISISQRSLNYASRSLGQFFQYFGLRPVSCKNIQPPRSTKPSFCPVKYWPFPNDYVTCHPWLSGRLQHHNLHDGCIGSFAVLCINLHCVNAAHSYCLCFSVFCCIWVNLQLIYLSEALCRWDLEDWQPLWMCHSVSLSQI